MDMTKVSLCKQFVNCWTSTANMCLNMYMTVPLWPQYYKGKLGELGCCLMTPGLGKDIRCHFFHTFSKLANHQIRHQVTRQVCCQSDDCIYGQFNLLR